MISIILDVLVVAIIVLSVVLAYRKGLIKTLFSLVGGIAAVVLAISMSAPVAEWIDEKFVGPTVQSAVLTAVNGSPLSEGYDTALEKIDVAEKIEQMPQELRAFLEKMNIDVEGVQASAEQSAAQTAAAREQLIMDISAPVSATISKAIALIALVVIFFLLLFVASRLLDTVFRVLPFGKKLNHAGGLVFGMVRALLFVMLFGAVVYGLAMGNVWLSLDDVENTFILNFINQYNPILTALL